MVLYIPLLTNLAVAQFVSIQLNSITPSPRSIFPPEFGWPNQSPQYWAVAQYPKKRYAQNYAFPKWPEKQSTPHLNNPFWPMRLSSMPQLHLENAILESSYAQNAHCQQVFSNSHFKIVQLSLFSGNVEDSWSSGNAVMSRRPGFWWTSTKSQSQPWMGQLWHGFAAVQTHARMRIRRAYCSPLGQICSRAPYWEIKSFTSGLEACLTDCATGMGILIKKVKDVDMKYKVAFFL
jgi:hypothetical protein